MVFEGQSTGKETVAQIEAWKCPQRSLTYSAHSLEEITRGQGIKGNSSQQSHKTRIGAHYHNLMIGRIFHRVLGKVFRRYCIRHEE